MQMRLCFHHASMAVSRTDSTARSSPRTLQRHKTSQQLFAVVVAGNDPHCCYQLWLETSLPGLHGTRCAVPAMQTPNSTAYGTEASNYCRSGVAHPSS